MANPNYLSKSSLTLYLALAAFLISLSLIFNDIKLFIETSEWSLAEGLSFAQLIVFALSAYIAYTTINSGKSTAKERATLDTILDDNKDETLFLSKRKVLKFSENPKQYFEEVNCKESKRHELSTLLSVAESDLTAEEAEIRMHLLKVLNRYEFYAIGINKNLLDEEMFKRMYCSTMLKFWAICNPAVSTLRETAKKDTLFKEFECLALRWKANPLKTEDIK